MTESDYIKNIDTMNYEQMLRKYRFAPSGDPYFQGSTGDYFMKRFEALHKLLSPSEIVEASKTVGWKS